MLNGAYFKKQSDTTLQVFVIFLIFLDFTKWKPKLIHDLFFLILFEVMDLLLDKQFILLKHIIIYGFTISLSTISNYEMVFYFFLSFQVPKKKYASNCNCFFTIYFATI